MPLLKLGTSGNAPPSLTVRYRTRSEWCQVCPSPLSGGGGRVPSSLRMCQLGCPWPSAPWQTAQVAAKTSCPVREARGGEAGGGSVGDGEVGGGDVGDAGAGGTDVGEAEAGGGKAISPVAGAFSPEGDEQPATTTRARSAPRKAAAQRSTRATADRKRPAKAIPEKPETPAGPAADSFAA